MQQTLDRWRHVHNVERPRKALGMATLIARNVCSQRAIPDRLPELDTPPVMTLYG
ncbi:hypothetical protein G3N95_05800 [Paraburkholderia sp. Tr-20389]|uniref:hypothetical protein n=1 Tax=Paraburkholderia sp. Tr-20389 TaxID=2703903 RepID=UPI00197DC21E|nr:hypothetical protein [Paraburkholderia sp. Tr-20389]MBN3752444.1 hypothetical protein [Paraburkholderia sp. Tr-20389]